MLAVRQARHYPQDVSVVLRPAMPEALDRSKCIATPSLWSQLPGCRARYQVHWEGLD